jgi:hypothetical protein
MRRIVPNADGPEGGIVIAGVFSALLWIVLILVAIGVVVGFVARGRS